MSLQQRPALLWICKAGGIDLSIRLKSGIAKPAVIFENIGLSEEWPGTDASIYA